MARLKSVRHYADSNQDINNIKYKSVSAKGYTITKKSRRKMEQWSQTLKKFVCVFLE